MLVLVWVSSALPRRAETPPDYSPDATPLAPAPTQPTRAALVNVNLAPSSPEGCTPPAALSTPDWLLGENVPSPPACPSTYACPVCLCEFPAHPELKARKRCFWGHAAAMHCTWGVLFTLPQMSEICVAQHVGPYGRLKPRKASPQPAVCTVSARHSQLLTTTPRHAVTMKPRHRGLPSTSCRFAACAFSWQTRRTPHPMQLGKNCRIAICTGPRPTSAKAADGHRSGSAYATIDENHPLLHIVPEPPVCPVHGPRRLAVDMREYSRGWVCCRGSPQVLPCPTFSTTRSACCAHPRPLLLLPQLHVMPLHGLIKAPRCKPAMQRTHSWLFVPLLHAAVGRLHPALLRQAPVVEPKGPGARTAYIATARLRGGASPACAGGAAVARACC